MHPPFAQIFESHAPYAWRALRRLGASEADAEDLCQEVFLVVHRKLPEFEGRSSLRTWIYGICARVVSDHRKRAHMRRERITEPPERAGSAPQLKEIERRQALGTLDEALDALREEQRAVFVLYEIEGLPMSEVAEALGCPLQTAYSRLHAARKQIRLALTAHLAGEGSGEPSGEPSGEGSSPGASA